MACSKAKIFACLPEFGIVGAVQVFLLHRQN